MAWDDEDEELEPRAVGIARPDSMENAAPSTAVRGLPAPAPTPAMAAPTPAAPTAGSTEDLESKALASHLAPHIAAPDTAAAPRGLRPQPGDFQPEKMPLWEKILSPLAIGAASYKNPGVGEKLMDQFYEAPKREAQQRYETASTAYDKELAEEKANEPKPKEEKWTVSPLYTDLDGTPLIHEENSGQMVRANDKKAPAGFKLAAPKAEKPDTPEQQLLDAEAAVAGAKTPEEKSTAQGNLDRLKKSIGEYSSLSSKPEKGGAADARADRSYTYNNNKLDTLAKPIEDAQARMGRLRESLAQGTPQADALVAPELLTIMAGGAGSGLRMNEAEISRIVGGRSKWQSLQAAINQWSLDPTKANSITPEQRQQIRDLTEAVNAKLEKKQQALDAAREGLLNSDDPKEHRRIVTEAHHALTQVDQAQPGGNQPEAPKVGTIIDGYKFKGGNPADQKSWEAVPK